MLHSVFLMVWLSIMGDLYCIECTWIMKYISNCILLYCPKLYCIEASFVLIVILCIGPTTLTLSLMNIHAKLHPLRIII